MKKPLSVDKLKQSTAIPPSAVEHDPNAPHVMNAEPQGDVLDIPAIMAQNEQLKAGFNYFRDERNKWEESSILRQTQLAAAHREIAALQEQLAAAREELASLKGSIQ